MTPLAASEMLTDEELNIIVRKTLESTDFRILEYKIGAANEIQTGFLGEHSKLKVRALLEGGQESELSYFVKTLPRSVPQHLEYALNTRAFYKEIQLYETLFVDLRSAEKEKKRWHPECYYARGEELVVIEDLNPRGFYMLPERTLMGEDHVRASLRAMASMHASCFVFQDKLRRGVASTLSPNREKSKTGNLTLGRLYSHLTYETEVSDIENHCGNTFIRVGIKSQVNLIDLLENYSENEKNKIKEKFPRVMDRIFELVKPSDKYENVFVHGDLWANNILFRNGKDGKVEEAIIIDFQLARYAPPAHDLMMFFYLVQDREFRMKNESRLLEYYYKILSEEMSENKIPVESFLQVEAFRESCGYYRELGLLSAVLYFQLIKAPNHVTGKFMASPELYKNVMLVDRSEMIRECFNNDEIFRERMTEAMDELISELILN